MSNFPHIFAPFPSPLREFTRTTPGALCTYGYCDAFMHLGNTYFNFFRYSVLIIVIVSNCSHASVTSFDCVHTVIFVKFWQVMVVTRIIWTIFRFFITINNDQIISSIFTSFMFFIGSFSIGHTVCIGGDRQQKLTLCLRSVLFRF